VRIDLKKLTADILITKAEYERRRKSLVKESGFKFLGDQPPWNEIRRGSFDKLSNGMTLKLAAMYQKVAVTTGVLRDNR
jgi:dihydroxy-acid dehydratase